MYLSKVFLHPGKLNNAYEWHRALWSLFPNIERDVASPFLYVIESLNLAVGARVLMQSAIEPLNHSGLADVQAVKPLAVQLRNGQRLGFRIFANPSKCIDDKQNKTNKKNRGKCRVPLIHEDAQCEWLTRKLKNSASLHGVSVTNQAPLYFRKGNRAGKVVPALFEGVIEVCDADQMMDVWKKGVGPAKAFGCGLLLVRRA